MSPAFRNAHSVSRLGQFTTCNLQNPTRESDAAILYRSHSKPSRLSRVYSSLTQWVFTSKIMWTTICSYSREKASLSRGKTVSTGWSFCLFRLSGISVHRIGPERKISTRCIVGLVISQGFSASLNVSDIQQLMHNCSSALAYREILSHVEYRRRT